MVLVLVDTAVADWTDDLSVMLVEFVALGVVTIVSGLVALVDVLSLLEVVEVVVFGVVITVSVASVFAGAEPCTDTTVLVAVTVEVTVLAVV